VNGVHSFAHILLSEGAGVDDQARVNAAPAFAIASATTSRSSGEESAICVECGGGLTHRALCKFPGRHTRSVAEPTSSAALRLNTRSPRLKRSRAPAADDESVSLANPRIHEFARLGECQRAESASLPG
jgi:hypothetical protein